MIGAFGRNATVCGLAVGALLCGAVVAAAAAAADDEQVVYENNFEKAEKLDGYWSTEERSTTPAGARQFLGRFGEQTITLTLKNLPAHKYLRVQFDLFIIGRWHGWPNDTWPALWRFEVKDGPTLVNATFSNWPDVNCCNTQSYPSNHPLRDAPGQTGATEVAKLGFKYNDRFGDRDAVYPMAFVFHHDASQAEFTFSAKGLKNLTPSSWGLDNMRIATLDKRTTLKLDEKQLRQAWEDLGAADAIKAHQATWELIGAEDQAVAFLATKGDAVAGPQFVVRKLIRQLDDDDYFKRVEATKKLQKAGTWAKLLLLEALEANPSQEARWRLKRVLGVYEQSGVKYQADADFRRAHRARYVLDVIGTPTAKKLLDGKTSK